MNGLDVEIRTYRVGGDLTWGGVDFAPLLNWVDQRHVAVLIVLGTLLVITIVWRYLGLGKPKW